MSDSFSAGDARCIKETDKALLVYVTRLEDQVWIPKSQIHDDSEVFSEGDDGDLVVTEWYADQVGWT